MVHPQYAEKGVPVGDHACKQCNRSVKYLDSHTLSKLFGGGSFKFVKCDSIQCSDYRKLSKNGYRQRRKVRLERFTALLGDSQDVSSSQNNIEQVSSPEGESDAHHVSIYMEDVQSKESGELTP